MNEYIKFIQSSFIKRIDNEVDIEKFIGKLKQEVDNTIEDVPIQWTTITNEFLYYEPQTYWNGDIAKCTFNKLESIYASHGDFKKTLYVAIKHFFISYFLYKDTISIIRDLEPLNENPKIKTRLYRLPTYISIIEGCLANLFRFLRDLIDLTVEKDLTSQDKLNPLCEIMTKYDLEKLCLGVDVDVRNAINHGGIIVNDDSIVFFFYKERKQQSKSFKFYEFDQLIESVLDNVSGIFVGVLWFFAKYPELFESIDDDLTHDDFIFDSFTKIQLSTPNAKCTYISSSPFGVSQLNLDFTISKTDREYILLLSIEIATLAYLRYPQYENYFIGFKSERMLPGWTRYKREEMISLLEDKSTVIEIIRLALERQDILIWDENNEDIDIENAKHFRFPSISSGTWKIREITDVSVENVKRIKANLFIGELFSKRKIIRIVNDAIRELKKLYTPPALAFQKKYGDMPADAVYLNVYIKDNRRRDKSLLPSNPNFIMFAEYNFNGKTMLENGGVTKMLWDMYVKEHSASGNILYAWNPRVKIEDFGVCQDSCRKLGKKI